MRLRFDRHAWVLWGLAFPLGLSACGDRQAPSAPPEPQAEVASGLETLAVESGALVDGAARDPVGSYGRTYDGGRDRLCITSDAQDYRFGAEIRIGDDEFCSGGGTAKRSGERLILSFADSKCRIIARYEGDRIVMPGAVDTACAELCSNRGTLAGVTFPRTGGNNMAARRVRSIDSKALCG